MRQAWLVAALGAVCASGVLGAAPEGPSRYPSVPAPVGAVHRTDGFWRARLETTRGVDVVTGPSVTAIPHFAWANRGRGEMLVWVPYQ